MHYPFSLVPLPYAYGALEPYIDTRTVTIHHDKHQQAYVDNLNAALSQSPSLANQTLEELLSDLDALPPDIRQQVINQGGGVYNHTFYWNNLSPTGSSVPLGALKDAIDKTFGSYENFKAAFTAAALANFGSGWTWLVSTPDCTLEIISTANQDTPISQGLTPIMTMDVWEHAYYLKHQNRRADYINALWHIINWEYASNLFNTTCA